MVTPAATPLRMKPHDRLLCCDLAVGLRCEKRSDSDNNVDAAVKSYLGGGVPADKIALGVRFVGTGWQGVGSTNNGLYQPDTGPAPGTWDAAGSAPAEVSVIRT
jgi:hypothetical protein